MDGSTSTTCEFCGRPLMPRYVKFGEKSLVMVGHRPCDCPQAVEAREERDAGIDLEEERRRERERLDRLTRAGIGLRYIDAEHPKADEVLRDCREGTGAYIVGPVGCGKTHLASAVAVKAVDAGLTVRMRDAPSLLADVRSAYDGEGTEADALAPALSRDLLVIDDLGKEAPTEWALQMLFRIVDGRYRDLKPVLVTSQFRKSGLAKRLARKGDPETAEAIVSRLTEMCRAVRMDGEDRRLK